MGRPDLDLHEISRVFGALTRMGFSEGDEELNFAVDRFGELLLHLSHSERDALLWMLDRFLCVHDSQYFAHARELLAKVGGLNLSEFDDLIILPVAESGKDGRPRSSSVVLYTLQHRAPLTPSLQSKRVRVCEKAENVASLSPKPARTMIVLVDDFIGSGDSAIGAIDRVLALGLPSATVVVAAFVAQESALGRIRAKGVHVSANLVRKRGLSDATDHPDVPAALATVDALEQRMGVPPDYRRGFRRAEALVKMIRCPDNTFPVFWSSGANGRWPAPFHRFQ